MIVGRAVAALLAVTAIALSSGEEVTWGATSCGDHGWGEAEAGHPAVYDVQGELRTRDVSCRRAQRVVGGYLHGTRGEGGPLTVRGFRCRGGPRAHHRFIVDCRRDGGAKRVFLDGTGGPG